MKNLFHITLQNRKILHSFLNNMTKEQLLKIPQGYRNNIWWNIAHVVVTQQLLVYKLSGNEIQIPNDLIDKFKKGTVPDGTATDEEIKIVKELLFTTIEQTEVDYNRGLFNEYNEYTTSVKITIGSFEDAVAFNVYHEGLHLGAILSLQKMLKN